MCVCVWTHFCLGFHECVSTSRSVCFWLCEMGGWGVWAAFWEEKHSESSNTWTLLSLLCSLRRVEGEERAPRRRRRRRRIGEEGKEKGRGSGVTGGWLHGCVFPSPNLHTPLSVLCFASFCLARERVKETRRVLQSNAEKRKNKPVFHFFSSFVLGSWLCYKQMLLVFCSHCSEAACTINGLKDDCTSGF